MYETGKYHTKQLAQIFHVHKGTVNYYLKMAGVRRHGGRKLTPEQYKQIRATYVPYTYPVSKLALEYHVSPGLIEAILGMRTFGRGKRLPHALHPQEVVVE
jgi:hypothetical protein